jgi:hypothetical protein
MKLKELIKKAREKYRYNQKMNVDIQIDLKKKVKNKIKGSPIEEIIENEILVYISKNFQNNFFNYDDIKNDYIRKKFWRYVILSKRKPNIIDRHFIIEKNDVHGRNRKFKLKN